MIYIVLNYTFIKIKNHIAPKKIVLIQYNIMCLYIAKHYKYKYHLSSME